jgi:hypothetical protein
MEAVFAAIKGRWPPAMWAVTYTRDGVFHYPFTPKPEWTLNVYVTKKTLMERLRDGKALGFVTYAEHVASMAKAVEAAKVENKARAQRAAAFLPGLTGWENAIDNIRLSADTCFFDEHGMEDVVKYGLDKGWDAQDGLNRMLHRSLYDINMRDSVPDCIELFLQRGAVVNYDTFFDNTPDMDDACAELIDLTAEYGLDPRVYIDWPNYEELKECSTFLQDPSQWPRAKAT